MARPKADDPKRQISIHLDEVLLEQLAAAAKQELRSVSGEIAYRLRRSFEEVAFRLSEATPVVQAAALRPWGRIPFAWPRDGGRETLEGADIALANQYKAQGLEMLHE